jgi:tRNA A58 N-methylase Trm61
MQFTKEVNEFISTHLDDDIREVALKLSKLKHLPKEFILNQINGKQKAIKKFSSLFNINNIIYPPDVNLQQSSSEITAKYKSDFGKDKTVLDLTGGWGVDTLFFAQKAKRVTYVEPKKELFDIAVHNFKVLEKENISYYNQTAEDFLKENNSSFDIVFLDPDRRVEGNRKIKLEEYSPNVLQLYPKLLKIAEEVLIKVSPLLDIKEVIKKLPNIVEVHIVAVKNECKEVLYLIRKNEFGVTVNTINIEDERQEIFSFDYQDSTIEIEYSQPLTYLYEPNAAIMKSGGFNEVAKEFGINKLANNSHLYTSNHIVKEFPGKLFEVIETVPYQKDKIEKYIEGGKLNVAVRNFKETPQQIKKKLKIKDGGEYQAFFTTILNNKQVCVICKRINLTSILHHQ